MSTEAVALPQQRKTTPLEERLNLSAGVSVRLENTVLTITGPLGSVKQDFSRIPVNVNIVKGAIVMATKGSRRRDRAVIRTAISLARNAVLGVTRGYTYKLKVVFAHFPVAVKVQGKKVLIENFYGERSPRIAEIKGESKVEVQGEDLVVSGISAQDVGQTAANIEQATTVRRKDQRVFLDGVYIYSRKQG